MKPLIICVASKDEADLLLSKDLDLLDDVIQVITGFGFGSTISALKEYAHECTVLNVGFVGIPDTMDLHKLYSINTSILGPNEHGINRPITLSTIDNLPQVPCISVADFETNTKRFYPTTCYTKNYVVDMELYMLANMFDKVYSLKIPSDTGDMDEYDNQHKYKKDLAQVRSQIYNIVCDLLDTDI